MENTAIVANNNTAKSPGELMQIAVEQGYGAEALTTLERMMELQLRWEANEAKKEFDSALVRVHGKIPRIVKTKNNPQTRSKYAPLDEVINQTKAVYSAEGFSITFYEGETPKEDCVRVCADVAHSGGHTKTYYYDSPMEGKGIKGNVNMTPTHAKASSVSYGRRYLMCMIWNIPTSDDDGNAAGGQTKYVSEDQQTEINDLLDSIYGKGTKQRQDAIEYMGVKKVSELTFEDYKKHRVGLKQLSEKRRAK